MRIDIVCNCNLISGLLLCNCDKFLGVIAVKRHYLFRWNRWKNSLFRFEEKMYNLKVLNGGMPGIMISGCPICFTKMGPIRNARLEVV